MLRRGFNANIGDRVARIPGSTRRPTTKFEEAMAYATHYAWAHSTRVTVRRHSHHGWWLVLVEKARA